MSFIINQGEYMHPLAHAMSYGSTITVEQVWHLLEIRLSYNPTREEFLKAFIQETLFMQDITEALLHRGLCLVLEDGVYRVLLPNENAEHAAKMIKQADELYHKAAKLTQNNPKPLDVLLATSVPNNIASRVRSLAKLARRQSILN